MQLVAGENPLRLHASLNTPGALDLSLAIRAQGAGEIHFDQAVMLRRPKILYVSADTADGEFALAGDADRGAVRCAADRVNDFPERQSGASISW